MTDRIMIYTDGSCPKQQSVGGWAFAMLIPGDHQVHSGSYEVATSMTMEMAAVLEALRLVKKLELRKKSLKIISDNQVVVKGMTIWADKWKSQNYEGVANSDWWKLMHRHQSYCDDLEFQWVKGHGSTYWNNYVDRVAGQAQKRGLIQLQMIEVSNGSEDRS